MPNSSTESEARILAISSDPTPESEIPISNAIRTLISSVPNAVSLIVREASREDNSSVPIPYSANCARTDKSIKSPPSAVSASPNCAARD